MRALLASGLVLGVGSTLTLSSWNDSEYIETEIEAGTFMFEGSRTGQEGSFEESSEEAAHALTFSSNAGQMYPGSSTYALFSVRTQSGSLGGTSQVQPPQWDRENPESLGHYLNYGIRILEGTTCNEETFAASAQVVVDSETPLLEVEPQVTEQVLAPDAQETVNYCIELALPVGDNNDAQGATVAPQWEFLGTSTVDE
ncbi:MAG: SipW-dependent-type signal peptide-containing protein [Yaniella sp.]|uniref:SipW-dependent-type signal peptide-containing protein n=1 Tax=Yaniella sp. TaxID=2773929 RepID=UPI0026487C6E|nr:SipW-dependent-type signal peptide-containing protein [Yaniella sp.]MDN5732469.1 SipW-dependent-type signal peptide-containing protein [Yaniella sp.]MDN5816455.1 SipW-dependent-type signal peptide-containing protein [Yaniella sp.]MDN5818129.1 SipW-dependent-type signal peptide-containing protein [Yaniella sp.]MDN5839207.1 SipW-dependent-type signal peptide-containing protein [Yaniella sp.]MDN5912252.1 SipW-dependent-type signal peptide-containing protein [Yaniella sp.]